MPTAADAKTPAALALKYRLCRTEHMFFGESETSGNARDDLGGRLAREKSPRQTAPLQRGDFIGIFSRDGRFPSRFFARSPLHEFLPNIDELLSELAELKMV